MRKLPLLTLGAALAAGAAVVACSQPGGERDLPRGGWDGNSGAYNGNLGSFGTVSGLPGIPAWASEPTGPGTVNNSTVYGLQYADDHVMPPCARATAGLTDVRFLSSTRAAPTATAIGPDLEVTTTAGGAARLALGDTVVFPGHLFDGYLNSIEVMYEVQRVDTLVYHNASWYEWPVFALRLCENSHAGDPDHPHWKHLGFVSWAPFVRLPELPGETFQFRGDLVQAVTTIPRIEYRNNPNVPAVVATQTGAVVFKFAFFAGLPVALHGEPALDLRSSTGAALNNAEFNMRGGLALGNASWVHLTVAEDPQQHIFPALFTRSGTEVALFSLARGDGTGAAAIHLPTSWGADPVTLLELSDDERTAEAADSLDNVQGLFTTVPSGQRIAAAPSHAASGRSNYRAGLYLGNSTNNRKYEFFRQFRANAAATNLGSIVGRVPGQTILENDLRLASAPAAYVIGAESPLTADMDPFEQETNIDPPPPGAPVIPPVMPIDAAVPDAPVDAPIDAGTDAADAAPDAPADAAPDAPADAAPDAPPDAGVDAMADAAPDAPADAAVDAVADAAIDAPVDAPEDAAIDAPDAQDGGPPGDGPVACAVGCDDASPG